MAVIGPIVIAVAGLMVAYFFDNPLTMSQAV